MQVDEPTKEEALAIVEGVRDKYEAHHKVRITDEALRAAVALSDRYIPDRCLPDKAIDLMDEAASRVRIHSFTPPPDMKALEGQVAAVAKEKEEAVRAQAFEKAAALRDHGARPARRNGKPAESLGVRYGQGGKDRRRGRDRADRLELDGRARQSHDGG